MLGLQPKLNVLDDTNKNTWDYYIPEDYQPTQKEIDYCLHDSYIVAVGISNEWDNNRKRLTNSSESYHNAKSMLKGFDTYFPKLDNETDKFVRATYNGGEVGVNPLYAGKELDEIYGYDVNGLYGYVLDECILPYGELYDGEPLSCKDVYFVHFFCEFEVKDKMFPFLHIKRNLQYSGRETEHIAYSDGLTELKMTSIDYELFKKHYHIFNDCDYTFMSCRARKGLLSPVIKKNLEMKEYYSSKEHRNDYLRQVAKDNTNMLYGSFGLSTIKDECVPYINEDGTISIQHIKSDKQGRYIPMASFTTAQARKITISAIQKNYDRWIYSDTDSMYLLGRARGINIDSKKSGYWKYETYGDFVDNWDGQPFPKGKFLRPKTYCLADEHKNIYNKILPNGRYITELKCAGMPDRVKQTVKWDDFYLGATFSGKLQHKVVNGGVCLMPVPYRIG